MIKLIISLLMNWIDPSQKEFGVEGKLGNFITKLREHPRMRKLLSWILFLTIPYFLLYTMDVLGRRDAAAELQPQVASIYEIDTQEPLDKKLSVIWRTPKKYNLMKPFTSHRNRAEILQYYDTVLQENGWKYESVNEFYAYDTHILISQDYSWIKNGCRFIVTFYWDEQGTIEKVDENGRLIYLIFVAPTWQTIKYPSIQ